MAQAAETGTELSPKHCKTPHTSQTGTLWLIFETCAGFMALGQIGNSSNKHFLPSPSPARLNPTFSRSDSAALCRGWELPCSKVCQQVINAA